MKLQGILTIILTIISFAFIFITTLAIVFHLERHKKMEQVLNQSQCRSLLLAQDRYDKTIDNDEFIERLMNCEGSVD